MLVEPHQIDFDRPGKSHYQVKFHLDGTWGYSLVPLTVINGERGPNPNGVIAFGGTHGNEYEGQIAVKRLCADLDPSRIAGRVILIPQLSESACVAGRRTSPLDGVNMNRAFPGNPRGSASSRIAHFVTTQIFPHGRVILDLHSGGREGGFPLCTSFHPIPDPAQRREITAAARLFHTPFVLIYSSDMATGLLTDQAEAAGKIAIGGEFGFGESASRHGVYSAYEGVRNVLRHYGHLEGPVAAPPPDQLLVKADRLNAYVPCPADGYWEPVEDPGAKVESNTLIGRLHDFSDHSQPALEIRSPGPGYLIMMHGSARPVKGQTLFVLAEEVPWE